METALPMRAWLLMAAGDNRGHGGNTGYDDQIDAYYSWDSNVPNHKSLRVGDPIALWDKTRLLGTSVIEEITAQPGPKILNRCPSCDTTRISERTHASPRWRCMKCRTEFAAPRIVAVDVLNYRARYDAGWTSLDGVLNEAELRALAVNPREFNAMRALDWAAFCAALIEKNAGRAVARAAARYDLSLPPADGPAVTFAQGHQLAVVRVRRGQRAFREHLLAEQGTVCAFTGSAPARVLDAGHLYSYAHLGTHHAHGGLMLRRDIHRLFDDGQLAVDPVGLRVDVADELATFPQYRELHGHALATRLHDTQVDWLATHWAEHRAS